MRFIVQAVLIFVLLWCVPELGAWDSHAKTGMAVLAATFGSLLLTFVADLLAAPSKIDRDQVSEIKMLREVIASANDQNQAIGGVSQLWHEGRDILDQGKDPTAWRDKVDRHLREHFQPAVIHRFARSWFDSPEAALTMLDNLASNSAGLEYLGDWNRLYSEPSCWLHQSKRYTDNTETWAWIKRAD